MYGLTRATTTLLGAALAGLLIYLGVEIVVDGDTDSETAGEFWSSVGLFAVAGFVMALSQLLGGWTKWGWPRISLKVFLIAFLPVLIVTLWIVLAGQPEDDEWLRGTILDWSDDIGVGDLVDKLLFAAPVIVFGAGLVLGLSLDTSGPRLPSTETVITGPPRSTDETVVDEEPRRVAPGPRRTDD